MLGAPLDDEHVHNIELVQDIVKRDMGAIVTPRMLDDLVSVSYTHLDVYKRQTPFRADEAIIFAVKTETC